MWRPFRSAKHCMLSLGSAHSFGLCITLFSHAVCHSHVGKCSMAASPLCSAEHLSSRCIRPPSWPAASFACGPGNQIEIMVRSSICRALCLQVRSWAQGDRPAGILPGGTAQVTWTAVWSLMHWASWGICLLGSQKAMTSDLGNNSSAVLFLLCLLQTGVIHWGTWATWITPSSQSCLCGDSYLTTW